MGEFLNTFENGIHRDNAHINQPPGTMFHCVNCSIISHDGNDFSLKDCVGNVKTFTLNIPFDTAVAAFQNPPLPIGFVSFPDALYVFYTNAEGTPGFGGIGKLTWLPYGGGIQPTGGRTQNVGFTPLYHHIDLDFTKMNQIEAVPITENDEIRRIYWTDFRNEPRVINVADPVFNTYITSGNLSAVAGTKYMVVEGSATYSGTAYGPGLTAGNIITTAGGVQVFTTTVGGIAPSIIEYVPVELFDWTPDKTLGKMVFKEFTTGDVYCGAKLYFYRLRSSGYATQWSYASSKVQITYPQDPDLNISDSYHNTGGAGTADTLVNSGKGVVITVSDIDTIFDTIELACVEYDQSPIAARNVSIVAVETITGTSMDLTHDGSNYGSLTLTDLVTFPAAIKKIKTMASSKNYMLIANIEEREEPELDFSGVTAAAFEYPMPTMFAADGSNDPAGTPNPIIYSTPACDATANPTTIVPNSRYKVTSVAGGAVTYDGNNYGIDEVIVGVDGVDTITIPGASQVRPCVHRNQYSTISGSNRREESYLIPDGDNFWNYKSAKVAHHCLGYWPNEKYRLGLMPIDKKGRPMYVRHLIDFTMPSATDKGGLMIKETYTANDFYSLNPSGIKLSGINIPKSLEDEIDGFCIVRAVRDKRIVAQGLVTQCVEDAGNDVRPCGWPVPNRDLDNMNADTLMFLSPDLLTDQDISFGEAGDTLDMAAWLSAYPYQNYAAGYGGQRQVVSKIIEPGVLDTGLQTTEVTSFQIINEREGVSNYDGAGNSYFNQTHLNSAGNTAPDLMFLGGGAYNLNDHECAGPRHGIMIVDAAFNQYNGGGVYTDSATTGGNENKIVMDYCKPNSNQYGGNSEQAIANTVYVSTGHYIRLTSTVKSETSNGNYWTFNDVEIFGGDAYLSLVDFGYALYDSDFGTSLTYSHVWQFPCYSNVNYELRRGRKTSNVEMFHEGAANANSIVYNTGGTTRLEDYEYNPGYSTNGGNLAYPGLPVNLINASQYEARFRFAGPKVIGEEIDSFRNFQILDFKDLDATGGRINKVAVKDNRVIAWMDKMVVSVPVLERLLLDDTTLGTGGVVDRFDVIKSDYGCQHQWSVVPTDYGFMWWDMIKKALLVMEGGSILEVSGGNRSYFNELINEAVGNQGSLSGEILNSQTLEQTSDRPLMRVGVTGVFDPKLKLTYMTFMFRYYDTTQTYYYNKGITVAYYHPRKMIVHYLDSWLPAIAHNHNQFVFAANYPRAYSKPYMVGMPATTFDIGNIVPYEGKEYVCHAPVTITLYPGTAPQEPSAVGSAYWTLLNSENEVWVNNQPSILGQATAPDYGYNKWFGLVVSNIVELIINPKTRNPFSVMSFEQKSNVKPTDMEIYTDDDSAGDTSIRATDRNYEVVWDRITSSAPLSDGKRLTDSYLKLKITKKNWTTNPTVLSRSARVLHWVKSLFVEKR